MIVNSKNPVLKFVALCLYALIVDAANLTSPKFNVPKDIETLFESENANDDIGRHNTTSSNGSFKDRNKIFAEGMTSIVNAESIEPNESSKNVPEDSKSPESKVNYEQPVYKTKPGNTTINKINSSDNSSKINSISSSEGYKNTTIFQKLNETHLRLIPDVYELTHVNGKSSIKPRKGVHYSSVVPRKGVDFDDIVNNSLPLNESCFFAGKNKCYEFDNFKHSVACNCCEISDEIGKLIKDQVHVDCSTCSPVNNIHDNISVPCDNICCKNISQSSEMKLIMDDNTSHSYKNVSKTYQVYETPAENSANISVNVNITGVNESQKSSKNKKLKPTLTKVPFDTETNPFSKYKGEKYVPIIVSIFILPLVGVFILLLWKKMRELWDRRYYKRVDFLIDGIYND